MMKNLLIICILAGIACSGFAQFSISDNKRFLLKDGKPFYWLGDTGWELFHRLTRDETDVYLKKRSQQGFTVIQAVVLAETDGLHIPNAEGETPLINDDPTKPNEKYFAHVDYVIDKAASYNINIALLPTWADKIFKDRWGTGPEIFNVQNAAVYASWLANRYKDKKNIIWLLGGDRNPRNEKHVAIWRAMGNAIMKATNNKAVISFHPDGSAKMGSAEWFHNDSWLSFNMFQTGHCRDFEVYDLIQSVYNMKPTKPVIDGESLYEDHPVCFNVKALGTSNSHDVRRSAYLDLFAGAFGNTYGCHDIWQFYSTKREPVNGPHIYWQEALDLPGANQMGYVRRLIENFPMLDRVPDQSLIKENDYGPAERIQSTRGNDYLMVYSTSGKPFTVIMGKISGKELKGYWYDPRTGKAKAIPVTPNEDSKKFMPPSSGYGNDWVLVLYDGAKDYNGIKAD